MGNFLGGGGETQVKDEAAAEAENKDPEKGGDGADKAKEEEVEEEKTLEQELRYYVNQNNEEKVRELVGRGADVNCRDEGLAKERAAAEARAAEQGGEAAKKKKKAAEEEQEEEDPKYRVAEKITGDAPLHIAAAKGHVPMISQLFFSQANLNLKNRIGSTPLHRAVSCGQIAAAAELIKYNADVHATNVMGNTPLHVACYISNLEMIKLLLAHDGKEDLKKKNQVYLTPIEYTQKNSAERRYLLGVEPSLQELVRDEEEEAKDQSR